ncbi:MAG: hypothetical protein B7Y12_12115 [Rhizobiales bacterium 24-66-13]|nr:MAG: hypothetical protein B7Y61_09380 [Rhizobiales bacterium 35-66-30]OYZ75885.1 MAG: hypothetical protein B7Y12_12115 [Rhizobiales bacterium 24-66-13]OZA99094.1 MAG: hypothetical protein B7X67_21430 [Rhizobiales bacterium 39-66-18]HQS09625.1 DUF4424 domain-containing protein [Xanthobacteraceae bacterium]
MPTLRSALSIASLTFACASAFFCAGPAHANDSSAELSAGGLVLIRNLDVEMRSEDLFISTGEVRVRYVFHNASDKSVTGLIAFPMPDITASEANISIPTEDPVNILDFKTRVNGTSVRTDVEQKVFVLGIDRTAMLLDQKVPLAPHLQSTRKVLDALPRPLWDEWAKIGLARVDEYDVGQGMKEHLEPQWTLKTTFYWMQTFPPKADTIIEHAYKPSVGASVGTAIGMATGDNAFLQREQRSYEQKFCMDRAFLSTVQAGVKKRKDGIAFSEERIGYILTTGANWSGPIGKFKLTVDKGAPNNLVSFCGTGVKKTGPTTFEMNATDFYPAEDLSILILKPSPTP